MNDLPAGRLTPMFDHVTIRVADRDRSARFYDAVLGELGVRGSGDEWEDFCLYGASAERPVTRNLHVGLAAPSQAAVDAFHRAGLAAGGRDDGAPGPRPRYRDDYYGGFLRDPDGVSVEAVVHGLLRSDGIVDHLWLRVGDFAAARAFWETIAPHAGLRPGLERGPGWVIFRRAGAGGGSLSIVQAAAGEEPTSGAHIAFGVADDATVDAFHAAAVAAGHRSDGAPGERPHYHPGYYAAFVLDPAGNSIELVNHNR
jgi:catechol 2,3-dioxygenase-like lactoylglutathione lyase family enzyme